MGATEKREKVKKKVLIYVMKYPIPVTPTQIAEALDIPYPSVVSALMELVLEGYLEYYREGWYRYFKPKQTGELRVVRR